VAPVDTVIVRVLVAVLEAASVTVRIDEYVPLAE
jgi:hypothetical protein